MKAQGEGQTAVENSKSTSPVPPISPDVVDQAGRPPIPVVPVEVITTPPDEQPAAGNQSQAVPPDGGPSGTGNAEGEDAASNASSTLVPFQFRRFGKDSYRYLLEREAAEKRQAQEKKDRPTEGRLVDGELVYDGGEGDEPPPERDQNLLEGNMLPEHLEQDFPKELLNHPIEEIDKLIKDKTFVVITKRFKKTYIHRFSATRAFFLLAPWNPLRRAAIYVATSQVFDYFIILTILANCVFLAVNEENLIAENIFLSIYTAELLIKLVARGFFLNSHTYLRDAWNWLDFVVVVSAYVTLIAGNDGGNLNGLRTFRVFRAFKTMSIVPGLKTIMGALIKSMGMLAEVIFLTVFCMMVAALFTLQVYIGILRQKCVKDMEPGAAVTAYEYSLYLKNESNWLLDDEGEHQLCGNATASFVCPTNYTCLPNIGENPNWGYTSFDHLGWAMLTSLQLITLDFWEDVYNKVIATNGPLNIIFFAVIVFFGSFYLINLMLAVVSMSYEEEALQAGKIEKEKERKREKRERRERKEKERKERTAIIEASTPAPEDAENVRASATDDCTTGDKTDERNQINNNHDKSASDTNHLQLASGNVNGSNSASNVSLKSNGQLTADITERSPSKRNAIKVEPGTDAGKGGLGGKENNIDRKGGIGDGGTNNTMATVDSGMGSSEMLVIGGPDDLKKQQVGEHNLIAEDNQSILSLDNQGDIPNVETKDDDDDLVDRNCQCCARCCHNYPMWLAFQNVVYNVVTDIVFELFISFCILINVLAMAVEFHNMSQSLKDALDTMNIIFITIFTIEAFLKLLSMGKEFLSAWNIFDILVVIVSYIDLGLSDVSGLGSVRTIRLLRLLRVFKLAQTWSTMRVLMSIIIRTLGSLANLTVVLIIVIYSFAVFGMQIVGKSYTPDKFDGEKPRWNFDDFWHALFLIFRVLCGEWIEPLWDCMRAAGEVCMIVFFPTLVFGNFVVWNLFLALMLNAFATDSINKSQSETKDDKMKKGWQRLKGLFKGKSSTVEPQVNETKKPSIADIVEELKRQQKAVYGEDEDEDNRSTMSDHSKLNSSMDNRVKEIELKPIKDDTAQIDNKLTENEKDESNSGNKTSNGIIKSKKTDDISQAFQTDRDKFSEFGAAMNASSKKKAEDIQMNKENSTVSISSDPERGAVKKKSAWGVVKGDTTAKNKKGEQGDKKKDNNNDEEAEEDNTMQDCFPEICCSCGCCAWYYRLNDSNFGRRWTRFREIVHKITENKVFEYFILLIILVSSIALCFEDVYLYQNPQTEEVLYVLDIAFAVIFTFEMLLKWIALGFKKYFTSFWTVLDFCIVVISILSLSAKSLNLDNIQAFRGLRTFRALRPLRAISRWEAMRIVVNALVYAIPAICNVLLVILVFWLLFAIAGHQLFGGKFYKCEDRSTGERVDASIVPDKATCLALSANGSDYEWKNSLINFDNTIAAYLALLQVATFEGWIEVMRDAVDVTDIDLQPKPEAFFHIYWFFVGFIIVGSLFSLNLLIGVIIDNFNVLKKKYEGGYIDVFLTDSQKNYYNTMKKLGNRKPQKTIKRPKNKIQGFFFDVAVSTKFELAIVVLIFLNMCAMSVEHYHQSEAFADTLDIVNIIFTTIFTLEAIVKIIGLRWHYFRRMWNVFDLIIVILSIVGVILDDLLRNVFITPTLLRVVRVFRIGRVLRLIKAAKGIRKLLFALVISIPALINIAMLLFIFIFIYAIFGMTLFGEVKQEGALNSITNFETFFNSFVLLFRLTTAAGWNDILEPLMNEHYCNKTHRTMPNGDIKALENGECGNAILAGIFMSSYIIITYLIIINMYIAVILENFNQAHEQEEVGITEDDFEMFYVVWERYDPHATQFIKVEYLSDLVADLDLPLGIPKPNEIALVAFDLPIMEGERLHCLDILTSLVKHVLGGVEDTEEFRNLKGQMEERYRSAFPTRVTQVQISSTMRRKKEDVAAKTLQRAWRKHKAQQSIRKITSMAMEAKLNKSLTRTSFSLASGSSPNPDRPSSSSSTHSVKVMASPRRAGNTLTVPSAERA